MIGRSMPRPCALLIAVCAAALALAGCGGGDTDHVRGGHLELRLDEYRITPQDVRVTAGRLEITAVNDGVLTHNVKIESVDRTDPQGDPIVVGGTATAHPGETVHATVELTPGRYRMACTIANHEDLGQYGTLVVTKR